LGSSGGGPDYSAALQAINQKLAEIDKKLDLAIAKIDALDNKLTAQHVEVMNALESISFDVNRTLQGVNQTQVDTYSRECVDIQNNFHNDPELPIANRVDSYKRCNEQLNNVNAGLTKNFLKAIPNLSTVDFQNSALVKLRKIAALHSKSDNWAEKNCFSLAVASSSLHELGTVSNVGLEQAENTAGKDLCRDVRSISDMLDPGMLTFFTTLEWTAADFSWKLGQDHAQEVMWGNKKRQAVAYRWANELRLLNGAVGQQSILVGDVTVPNWAGKLDLKTALDQTDIDVLNGNTILAQNSVRCWLQDHMDKTRLALQPNSSSEFGTSLKYAFAYFACSPDFLQSLTETGNDGSADFSTDFSRIHFRWSQAVKDQTTDFKSLDLADPKPCPTLSGLGARWCLKVDSLSTCIEMPTPDEATRGELLKSDNLEALINVREKIITLIETNDLIGGMNPDQRLRLIEGSCDQVEHIKGSRSYPTARWDIGGGIRQLKCMSLLHPRRDSSLTRHSGLFLLKAQFCRGDYPQCSLDK